MALNDEQRERAIKAMEEFLNEPAGPDGLTGAGSDAILDQRRVALIDDTLGPLIARYLGGELILDEFKSQLDSINKRKPYWGFKGVKGQMFFNMVYNVADALDEMDHELKAGIAVPATEQLASSRINTFASYVNRLREQWRAAGHTGYGCPKIGSVPFFLSYFWQIQNREVWPVYYTAAVNALSDLNIWKPSGALGEDYLALKKLHEELAGIFSEVGGRPFSLYDVEHVLWHQVGHPYKTNKKVEASPGAGAPEEVVSVEVTELDMLPDTYVPPVVGILPRLAINDENLAEAAKRSGTTIARAFEKSIDAAFTILGFDTTLLGQGAGRVPDGRALAHDYNYAILWDAKARNDGYSVGTDDRVIREYITTESRTLRRTRAFRNVYYVIISSYFSEDFDDAISAIKMETDVSEVCLLTAEALIAIVDAKLRAPLDVTLGPDGIQRLFSVSGVITAASVQEYFS